jgi:hypothetical protein
MTRKSVWRRKEAGTESLILAQESQEEMHAVCPVDVFGCISWHPLLSCLFQRRAKKLQTNN